MSELKPCPFCGGAPMAQNIGSHRDGKEVDSFVVRCNCPALGLCYPIRRDAIAAWNTRPAQAEAIKALEEWQNFYVVSSSGEALPSAVITPSKKDAETIACLVRGMGQVPSVRKESIFVLAIHYPEFHKIIEALAALKEGR